MATRWPARDLKGCIADALRRLKPIPAVVGFACLYEPARSPSQAEPEWTLILEYSPREGLDEGIREYVVRAASQAGYRLRPDHVHLIPKGR